MDTHALIFDLDGTVLNNELQYGKAFRKVLERLGVHTDKKYPHTSGIGVKENWPILIEQYGIDTELSYEQLEKMTRSEYADFFDEVDLQPGFRDFIDASRGMGYLTALATSNIWMTVEKVFDIFPIAECFDVVTTGEEVLDKKPDPSIFLLTSQKLGVEPSECIVFEDAQSGIKAAIAAGMAAVALARDAEAREQLQDADMVIEDFTDISVKDFTLDQ